jgi:hypothetical protein
MSVPVQPKLEVKNEFLVVKPDVVMTAVIAPVIARAEAYFKKRNLKAFVTSGFRSSERQLKVIRGFLQTKGLSAKYPEAMTCKLEDKNEKGEYLWQMAWSNLLNIGVIINPPLRARCLMDYYKNGRNLKGAMFPPTAHANGTCFDVGGNGNGVEDEAAALQEAIDDKIPGLVSIVIERENNCVHCNCTSTLFIS